jgi:ribosomal protein S18 acetylase RimI-like enzyme
MEELYMATPVVAATTPTAIDAVRSLFAEYAAAVDAPCCFPGFERELAELPLGYVALFLAGDAAGCVGLRRLDSRTAEMKRLYVRPGHRGEGLGRALAEAAIGAARAAGFERIVLDSLPGMREAQRLYRDLHFEEIAPYADRPTPGAVCYALRL